jgi:hypothetical protein
MKRLPALLVLMIAVASNSTLAQNTKIYRCGADGRELSQKPCPEGVVSTPDVTHPDAEQRRQAADVARRDKALGEQMAAERRQREAEQSRNAAGAIGIYGSGKPQAEPTPAASAASASTAKKPHKKKTASAAKPAGFTATSPKPAQPDKQPKSTSEPAIKP